MKRHRGQALGGPYLSIHLRRRDYIKARPGHIPSLRTCCSTNLLSSFTFKSFTCFYCNRY